MSVERIECILNSGCRAAFAVTGGGSGALHALLSTPGVSRFVADARIPYSPEALADFLGETPGQSVSSETARALAQKAFDKSPPMEGCPKGGVGFPNIGISCTAALATNRKRRGDDRAFICIKTAENEKLFALYFSEASRAKQEQLLSDWLLVLIAQAVGTERGLMLPGSFNPAHKGHFGMLKAAEEITGLSGVFELSAANVDKPELPQEEILRRAATIRDIPVALTHAPRFSQKAKLFPNTTFVLGHDTAVRLIKNNHTFEGVIISEPLKHPWECFQTLETSFLVAGRVFQPSEMQLRCGTGKFQPLENKEGGGSASFQCLENLELPERFEHLFEAIPEEVFREDISSTDLRGCHHRHRYPGGCR